MTDEILSVRAAKLELQKIAIKNKTPHDTQRYKDHRNMYNTLLRQHKQKYYADNLELNAKNPKRSWKLLKEAANLHKTNATVKKIEKI